MSESEVGRRSRCTRWIHWPGAGFVVSAVRDSAVSLVLPGLATCHLAKARAYAEPGSRVCFKHAARLRAVLSVVADLLGLSVKCAMSEAQPRSASLATRTVTLNDPNTNAQRNYCINFVRTCKYTVFSFVPMVIYIQFHRAANIYFLIVAVFQCIPAISPVGYSRPTIMVPMTFVLFVTAVKEFIEDWQRRKQDKRVNQSMTRRLLPSGTFEPVLWKDVVVGDWIEVRKNEGFPADLILFCTSEDEGLCYIETANLDGETNFKTKQVRARACIHMRAHVTRAKDLCARQAIASLQSSDTIEKLRKLTGSCECEAPNNRLYNFDGVYRPGNGEQLPLSNSQMLLRGTPRVRAA